ncbi:dynamin family protein [Candidatus Pristimantibacillus sp. PTI5]|uniref:dynamin family protein n=1 Tax=Candidatus Pristimantibacillus sp. PTI5 TaxID=3400422 RepID=UPI003B01CEF0
MHDMIRGFKEIATYLGEDSSLHLLEGLAARQQSGQFYLPVIGQFSAGKSSFLNALFGINYLPTKGTEATAYPTFISHGEDDQSFIEKVDGTIWPIELKSLQEYQHTDELPILGEIRALHVKLHHPLLESGLVLVDTPGFNTLQNSHEEVTLSVLPQAQYLMYVMGKSLTNYDSMLLNKVEELGIEVIFVRTKLDDIKASEEKVEDLLALEEQQIEKRLGQKRPVFGVACDVNALEREEWKQRLNQIRHFLHHDISQRLQELWEDSLERRIVTIKKDFTRLLLEKRDLVQAAEAVNGEALVDQVNYLGQQLERMEQNHRSTSRQFQSDLAPYQARIINEAKALKEPALTTYESELQQLPGISSLQAQAQDAALKQIERYMKRVETVLATNVQRMLEFGFTGFQDQMKDIAEQFQSSLSLSASFDLRLPDASVLVQNRQFAVEQISEQLENLSGLLLQSDEELAKYDLSKEQVLYMVQEASKSVAEARREGNELAPYSPHMKYVEGDTKASEIMGTIGNIADWAMVLIPGKAAANVVTKGSKLIKVPQALQKINGTAKALQSAASIADKAKKTAKIIEKVDKAHDLLTAAKNIQDKLKMKTDPSKAGILDAITLEFWFRKAGQLFDTPPRTELDKEAEVAYLSRKRVLENMVQQAVQKEMNHLEELRLLRSQEERMKKEKDLQLRHQKTLMKQLEAEQEKANRQAALSYAKQLKELFERELTHLEGQLLVELDKQYKEAVQNIIITATMEYRQKIESLRETLMKLSEEKKSNVSNETSTLQQLDDYLKWLNENKS